MGKLRHLGLSIAMGALAALGAHADSTATFGPLAGSTPPAGLTAIPGINSPCMSMSNSMGGSSLDDGISQIGTILGSKKGGAAAAAAAGGGQSCDLSSPSVEEFTGSCSIYTSSSGAFNSKAGDDEIKTIKAMQTQVTACQGSMQSVQGLL